MRSQAKIEDMPGTGGLQLAAPVLVLITALLLASGVAMFAVLACIRLD
jgi:hypothetical protein